MHLTNLAFMYLTNHKQMLFNLSLWNSGLNDCAAIYTNTDMFANKNVMFCNHKLLMQKGIRAFADQVTRMHLSTSCSSQSCSVHLDFETSFFAVYNISRPSYTQLPMNKSQCNSLTRTRFEKFANVRHYTETNAFRSVSAELRIALMCRILFK